MKQLKEGVKPCIKLSPHLNIDELIWELWCQTLLLAGKELHF